MGIRSLRITFLEAMGLIAVLALVFNHFRPLGREEAIKVAVAFLNAKYPSSAWSSSEVSSAVSSPIGNVWVVAVPDGKVRLEELLDNMAIVLVHFDGRCFRQGVEFSGLGGSVMGSVEDSGEWSVRFDLMGSERWTATHCSMRSRLSRSETVARRSANQG